MWQLDFNINFPTPQEATSDLVIIKSVTIRLTRPCFLGFSRFAHILSSFSGCFAPPPPPPPPTHTHTQTHTYTRDLIDKHSWWNIQSTACTRLHSRARGEELKAQCAYLYKHTIMERSNCSPLLFVATYSEYHTPTTALKTETFDIGRPLQHEQTTSTYRGSYLCPLSCCHATPSCFT